MPALAGQNLIRRSEVVHEHSLDQFGFSMFVPVQ